MGKSHMIISHEKDGAFDTKTMGSHLRASKISRGARKVA